MKEKFLNFLRVYTHYPRSIIDKILFSLYLKRKNKWHLFKPYFNKSMLLVCNGPSLNKTPLDKIDKVAIGMNKINLIYEKTSWRPEIIVCTNGLVLKQNKDFFNETDSLLLVPVKAYYLGVKKRDNVFFLNLKDEFKVNSDIETKISAGCTVTFLALQIAAYLKPTDVNIVGLDHSFNFNKDKEVYKMEGDDENHFSKDYFKGQFWGIPDLDMSEKLYQLSKEYFEAKQIPITDYTIEGKLQVFKKGPISEIVSERA
jgi:hypothetical protein